MKRIQITRQVVFHTGHMLKDDDSKCYHPHGHEYILQATAEGLVQTEGVESGMVMNFSRLKALLMEHIHDPFDHKFVVQATDPRYERLVAAVGLDALCVMRDPPTAENLVKYFFEVLNPCVLQETDGLVRISKLRLQETYQCWVEYTG